MYSSDAVQAPVSPILCTLVMRNLFPALNQNLEVSANVSSILGRVGGAEGKSGGGLAGYPKKANSSHSTQCDVHAELRRLLPTSE
jgi:hypothetical protein